MPLDNTLATLTGHALGDRSAPASTDPSPSAPPSEDDRGGGEFARAVREIAEAGQQELMDRARAERVLGPQTGGVPAISPPEVTLEEMRLSYGVDVVFERALDEDEQPIIAQRDLAGGQDGYFDPGAWPTYRRHALTPAVQIPKPFACRTIDGNLAYCLEGYLAVDPFGFPYPISTEVLQSAYEAASAVDDPPPATLTPFDASEILERLVVSDDDAGESWTVALEKLRAIAWTGKDPAEVLEAAPPADPAPAAEETPDDPAAPQEAAEEPAALRLPAGAVSDNDAWRDFVLEALPAGEPDVRELALTEAELEAVAELDHARVVQRGGRTAIETPAGTFMVAVD